MPGSSTVIRGNQLFSQIIYLAAATVPTVGANTSGSQSITVTGIKVGDFIEANQIGVVAGLSIDNIYVSAVDTLSFYWSNTTTGSLGGGTTAVMLKVSRPENYADGGLTAMPISIV